MAAHLATPPSRRLWDERPEAILCPGQKGGTRMMPIDVQTLIIIALLAFIVGLFAGVLLTRPRHLYRTRGGYRRYDDD